MFPLTVYAIFLKKNERSILFKAFYLLVNKWNWRLGELKNILSLKQLKNSDRNPRNHLLLQDSEIHVTYRTMHFNFSTTLPQKSVLFL